ncbi:hypothetical protein WA588_005814 [Blastocystis sp. NMH]
METIVREINRSYTSIEKGEKEGFDGAVFAEDHIHSVSETVTNKDVHTALREAYEQIKKKITEPHCVDDIFSVLVGCDFTEDALFVNASCVNQMVETIQHMVSSLQPRKFVLQFGIKGNQQKETLKLAASKLQYPCLIVHREDLITRQAKDSDPHTHAIFSKVHSLYSAFKKPVVVYIETVDGVTGNHSPSPAELLKRRTVEKALCEELRSLSAECVVVMSSEAPFSLKNELQDLQGDRVFYSVPTEEERRRYLEHLLSVYDNSLSAYALQRLLDHSSAFSLDQLRGLFDHAYLCMLLCKDHAIAVDRFDESNVSKSMLYQTVAAFIRDRSNGVKPVVPSIPDAILLSLLEKEKPAFSVVDVSRILDWCRSLQRPQEELTTLESLIRLLRERDETLRRCDLQNVASRDPVERRAGEPYVMPVVQTTTSSTPSITPIDTKTEPKKTTSLSSPKFCRMMSADVGESGAERYRREMAERDRLDAERVKEAERRNLEERERMRAEEEKRQRSEEERRREEFEKQKRKEEERQRRIEERLAAQEAERNKKIEEQRKKQEEAARKRQEEIERREEERRRQEQEEMERREAERQALAERRRQRTEEEIRKKEQQNQREAAEQMRRYEEERRRVYEMSLGGAISYQANSERLDREKSEAQKAVEEEQRKRAEAVKKAREMAAARAKQEKAQRAMEDQVYEKLAAYRRPAPATREEKLDRIAAAQKQIAAARERLQRLERLKEEAKQIIAEKKRREEEERKKKEEEERKKREEEERKRKEEEERKRKEEEERLRKKKEKEDAERRLAAEQRQRELEKEKAEMREKKSKEAQKMSERLMEAELRLLDCREKLFELKTLARQVKKGK